MLFRSPAGSNIILPGQGDLSRTGFTFGGWNTNASGTGTNYNAGSTYAPNTSVTLFARWILIPPGSVTVLTANTWADGNTTSQGGQEWFMFTATASTQHIHLTFGTLNDLYVQVYDSNFNMVGTTETNLWSTTRSTSRTLTNGQVYYIRIRPFSSTGSGTYQIAFNTSATRP